MPLLLVFYFYRKKVRIFVTKNMVLCQIIVEGVDTSFSEEELLNIKECQRIGL